MNIRTSDFSCINQDKTIRGVEYLPAGERLPAIIMSHGFGGCQAELTVADGLWHAYVLYGLKAREADSERIRDFLRSRSQ